MKPTDATTLQFSRTPAEAAANAVDLRRWLAGIGCYRNHSPVGLVRDLAMADLLHCEALLAPLVQHATTDEYEAWLLDQHRASS
jgi:hypothetical protein